MSTELEQPTVEPEAKAPPQAPEPDIAAEEVEATEEQEEKPKKPKGVGKRLSELTWQARQAERERDYWREQAMRNQYSQPAPQYKSEEPEISADMSPDQIVERVEARLRQKMEQEKLIERRNALVEQAENEGAYAFFNDATLPVTREIAEVVLESDHSLALASYLGENTSELSKIAKLPPHKQGAAIKAIEVRLSQPKQKPISSAPPPGPTIKGRASTQSPEAMSTEEWMRWRMSQLKR